MVLPDVLSIRPFTRPVRGSVALPGSKSLTNRALLLAALCEGPVTLQGALFSDDTELMTAALRLMGFAVSADPSNSEIRLRGRAGSVPAASADLFVGLAGTAARFLTALCAAAPSGVFRIDGVPQMRKRPMKGLIDALRRLGAEILCLEEEGFLPIEIRARGLRRGSVQIDASESSQMLSALLMVAPLAGPGAGERQADGAASPYPDTAVSVTLSAPVREPFVEMTIRLMRQFGVGVIHDSAGLHIPSRQYHLDGPSGGGTFAIEPDATAASYFLILPFATGGKVGVRRLRLPDPALPALQGDLQFAGVLAEAGMTVRDDGPGMSAEHFPPSPRRGGDWDFRDFSDTFLTLAAVAPLLDSPTRIRGIAHTRRQETDRIEAMATELRKVVGADHVLATGDSLEIRPAPAEAIRRNALRNPGETIEIEPHGDHRIAMSLAILGCHPLYGDGRPWIRIRNPACCAKTFPNFFDELDRLRETSLLPP